VGRTRVSTTPSANVEALAGKEAKFKQPSGRVIKLSLLLSVHFRSWWRIVCLFDFLFLFTFAFYLASSMLRRRGLTFDFVSCRFLRG
jgi:hypothetical protein